VGTIVPDGRNGGSGQPTDPDRGDTRGGRTTVAEGTKAVVDTSVADEAALVMALGELQGDGPDGPAAPDGTAPEADASPAAPADPKTADPEPAASEPGDREPGDSASTTAVSTAPASTAAASTAPASTAPESTTAVSTAPASTTPAAATERTAEATAPLSAAELDAELAANGTAVRRSSRGSRGGRPGKADKPAPAALPRTTSTATLDADTGTLPAVLPAPLKHSGDRIADRYRLEECFSQSETFSSWRAVDEKLRRAVGVHLLAAGHQRAKAVLTAARSAALLGDPRFVQVLDAVQEGELVYVIREWLPDAADLGHVLAAGPMEPYDAYQMVRQVTDAIAAAHRRGQAHLRLTPKCVLRTDSGQYRINGIAVDAALRGLPAEDAALTDVRAIGALLYAALTHRWPYPEDRYDLQGLPKGLGCVPPDQVKAGVHKGLSELAARILCDTPPHHKEPITSPEQLAREIALMPRVRQPEPPAPAPLRALPATAPRYATTSQSTRTLPSVEPAQAAPARPTRRRRGLRRAAKWTASAVALAAVAGASWQLVDTLNHSGDQTTTDHVAAAPTASSAPLNLAGAKLAIAGITPFNAFGDTKDEHVSELPRATDGNPATAWTTLHYQDPFGAGYRPGSGLLIDLGTARPVSSVDLQFLGEHTVELRAAPAGTATAPAADDAGFRSFGPSVATGSGTRVTLKPAAPVTTRFLLVWLTGIPTDQEGGYRGRIAEIQVNG